jgi:hypothetical protein
VIYFSISIVMCVVDDEGDNNDDCVNIRLFNLKIVLFHQVTDKNSSYNNNYCI